MTVPSQEDYRDAPESTSRLPRPQLTRAPGTMCETLMPLVKCSGQITGKSDPQKRLKTLLDRRIERADNSI